MRKMPALTWSSGDLVNLYINGVQDTPMWVEPPTVGTLTGCTKLIVGKGGKDIGLIVASWKRTIDDPLLDPCADIDHKAETFFEYRVYGKDLAKVVA